MEQEFEIRDHRNKEWFWIDDEYLNGYARLLSPAATLVYLAFCRHANKKQQSWPSYELLRTKLGLAMATISRAIKELEAWNIIEVIRSKNEATKRQNPNVYVLLHRKHWKPKPTSKFEVEVNTALSKHIEPNTGKSDLRNEDIQEVWEYGKTIGFPNTKERLNRFAIQRLIKNHGKDLLKKYAQYSQAVRQHQYAPQINNWMDLEEKLLKLRDFVRVWTNLIHPDEFHQSQTV